MTSLLNIVRVMLGGGPGSGCHGPNCGRPPSKVHLPAGRSYMEIKDEPLDSSWEPAAHWKQQAYGGVIVNTKGQFLLRSPRDFFDGYVWTWPKGKMDSAEQHPAYTALKEVAEETGLMAKILDPMKGTFKSGSGSHTSFYVMRPTGFDKSLMDRETFATKWASYEEAAQLLMKTKNPGGRARDIQILNQAQAHLEQKYGAPVIEKVPVPEVPPPVEYHYTSHTQSPHASHGMPKEAAEIEKQLYKEWKQGQAPAPNSPEYFQKKSQESKSDSSYWKEHEKKKAEHDKAQQQNDSYHSKFTSGSLFPKNWKPWKKD